MEEALSASEETGILERYVRNQLAMKELAEENERIKAFFKQDANETTYGRREVGKFYIQTSRNARVDDKLARTVLGDQYDSMTKQVIDTALAKRNMTPEQYETIQKVGEPKIEIGLV